MSIEAKWYHYTGDGNVQCTLCPHNCTLGEGKTGICRVRKNTGGKLITNAYNLISSINFDPIEKKPLYHFFPGSTILSIGSFGCNMRCFFCQNCSISQTGTENDLPRELYTPEQIIQLAKKNPENIGIAFTYNEPIIWFEYMLEIALLAKKNGLVTVMVTNGFINPEPLDELLGCIDAFSVDLKAFSEEFYIKVTSSKLEPVKEALRKIRHSGKHLEVVNLLIPELNDEEQNFTTMAKWLASELGKETILHISRYFPHYKLDVEATPLNTIRTIKRIAEKYLTWVYAGNTYPDISETNCQHCGNNLITRVMYKTTINGLDKEGKCSSCGEYFLKKI